MYAKHGIVDKIFTQDPVYTDVDKLILQEPGIIVLDNLQAFLEIDDFTAVFSYAADAPVREIVSDIT